MPFLETDPVDFLMVDGDIVITDDIQFTSGVAGIVQTVTIILRFFRGEYYLNLDAGVPWLERDGVTAAQAILGQKFDSLKVRSAILPLIVAVPGVKTVIKFDPTFDSKTRGMTRGMTIDWAADTVFGVAADVLVVE